jgi:hypothetical protein
VIAVCAVVAAVVSFVLGHLALILAAAAIVGGGTLAAVLVLRRYIQPRSARRALPVMAGTRQAAPAPLRAVQGRAALPPPRPRMIAAPAVHVHLHLDGPAPRELVHDGRSWTVRPPALPDGTQLAGLLLPPAGD